MEPGNVNTDPLNHQSLGSWRHWHASKLQGSAIKTSPHAPGWNTINCREANVGAGIPWLFFRTISIRLATPGLLRTHTSFWPLQFSAVPPSVCLIWRHILLFTALRRMIQSRIPSTIHAVHANTINSPGLPFLFPFPIRCF